MKFEIMVAGQEVIKSEAVIFTHYLTTRRSAMEHMTHIAQKTLLATLVSFAALPGIASSAEENPPASSGASAAESASQTGNAARSSGQTNTGQARTSEKDAGSSIPSVTYLVVPVRTPEQDKWMQKGCWARFYDDERFSGDSLTLIGPVDMQNMTGPFGIDWKGKISSVETGPKARVLVYDNENFRDLVATFNPGKKSPEVSSKMGFFDEFSSLKIACDNVQIK